MSMSAKELRAALVRLKKVRASRSGIAALACVRIDADSLSATDMIAHLRIDADTGIDAPRLVDPVELGKALKGLRAGDPVRLDAVPDSFGVRVNGITIPGVDPADWPRVFERDLNPRVPMPSGMWDAMRDVARAAVSGDDSRPVLTGVNVCVRNGDSLRITATDSYRLARVMIPGVDAFRDSVDDVDVILPVNRGKYLEALGDASGVGLVQSNGMIGEYSDWYADDAVLSLRRIAGTFPDADKLIPDAWEGMGTTDGMLEQVERIASVAGKDRGPLELAIENWEASIGWVGRESSVEPVVVGDSWDWFESISIGFNPEYLAAGLRFVGEGEPVRLISPLRPALLGDRYERCYLLMPVRLPKTMRERAASSSAA